MNVKTPLDTVLRLVDARDRGDIEEAIALYESEATLVARPGVVVAGLKAVRESLVRFAALRPAFESTARQIVESNGVALHCSQWSLRGTDPAGGIVQLAGRTADVLRKQPDGNWLIAIDNPWGTGILPQAPGRVTVPGKPSDDLAPGTLDSILKQAGLK